MSQPLFALCGYEVPKRVTADTKRVRRLFVKLRLHISRHKVDSLTVRKVAPAHQQTQRGFLDCSQGGT